jgi:hypothetical protein
LLLEIISGSQALIPATDRWKRALQLAGRLNTSGAISYIGTGESQLHIEIRDCAIRQRQSHERAYRERVRSVLVSDDHGAAWADPYGLKHLRVVPTCL